MDEGIVFYLHEHLVQGIVLETKPDQTIIVLVREKNQIYALCPDGTLGVLFTKTDEKHSWFASVDSLTTEQYTNDGFFVLMNSKWKK